MPIKKRRNHIKPNKGDNKKLIFFMGIKKDTHAHIITNYNNFHVFNSNGIPRTP